MGKTVKATPHRKRKAQLTPLLKEAPQAPVKQQEPVISEQEQYRRALNDQVLLVCQEVLKEQHETIVKRAEANIRKLMAEAGQSGAI